METSDLGYIKTLILNPSNYRTEVTAAGKRDFGSPKLARPEEGGTKYAHLGAMSETAMPQFHGTQAGDPAKLAKVFVDLVRGEGVAEGRDLPAFLPLGRDGVAEARKYAEGLLKVCSEWEDVITSTDFDE